MLFEPFRIKNVEFGNRLLRYSIGGRMAYYDGAVSPAWIHFEKAFAAGGVAGIISATISVNKTRMSPLEYPTIYDDRFVGPYRDAVREIKQGSRKTHECRYIIQLGDTGGATHTSLRSQPGDALTASSYFDILYGYRNRTAAMSSEQIAQTIDNFRQAARRVKEAGCDGVEITAAKGYLIHQFLNPGTNRRTDEYGGSVDKRFRLLEKIVTEVRAEVGPDFLFGIRLAAKDFNYLPVNIRWPPVWPLRHYIVGNDLPETTYYARKLEALGVDYLHIDCGFGFPNPKGSPGKYPGDGFKSFVNATRYLSGKAELRAILFNLFPAKIRDLLFGIGWKFEPAANADHAAAIRRAVNIPVIANGGFQDKDVIDGALEAGKCDMVAMARPLLANPDLLDQLVVANSPDNPCSFCTMCCAQTAVMPIGCYDESRFANRDDMMDQVIAWSSPGGILPFEKSRKKPVR